MKISNSQKIENRQAILDAAVDLIIEKGFRATSMRAIARKAGVGDATIYNYFSSKEALLYGYFLNAMDAAAEAMHRVESIETFDLRERLQVFLETILEGFLKDREFVDETFPSVFFRPVHTGSSMRAIRDRFVEIVREMFDAAVESGELPDMVLGDLMLHCIWDYFVAVTLYWLRDESEQFSNTTVFLDKSLDLGYTMLVAGVVQKVTDLASFLFKSHILSRIEMFMDQRETFTRIKDELLGHVPTR